jgi:hypothetical protein
MTEPYFNISSSNFTNETFPLDNYTYYSDLERVVSVSVFISFSFIFLAGLIGNGLVVMGECKYFRSKSRLCSSIS